MNSCNHYEEDSCVCDDMGEPKGQCVHCGDKWYNHPLNSLSGEDLESAIAIQIQRENTLD